MIEIEQQFPFPQILLPSLQQKLIQVKTKELVETYFDTKDFNYLRNDTWFRERNGTFELKYRKPEERGKQLEVYLELTSEEEIKAFLDVPKDAVLSNWIKTNLLPSIQMKTTRYTFQRDYFTVDVDITDFGYSVCEIEYSVDTNMETAKADILRFSKELGLEQKPAHNKAKAYIELKYPHLIEELTEKGIL